MLALSPVSFSLWLGPERGEVALPLPTPYAHEVVWHHTDANALLGILERGRLYASSPLSLNDSKEIKWGVERVQEAWSAMRPQCTAHEQEFIDNVLDELLGYVEGNVYLLCATATKDSLNQWQHYSRAQGYAIGLMTTIALAPDVTDVASKMPSLSRHSWAAMPGWWQVVYTQDKQVDLATKALRWIVKYLAGPTDSTREEVSLQNSRQCIGTLVCMFKHPAFKAEEEVRFIAPDVSAGLAVHWRTGPRGLVPFLKLASFELGEDRDLFTARTPVEHLPILSLMSGPTDEQGRTATRSTLKRLLSARGYGHIEPEYSEVPYRFG